MRTLGYVALGLSMLVAAGCYGPDREAGDDPNRGDETPMQGRPKGDPREQVAVPDRGAPGNSAPPRSED